MLILTDNVGKGPRAENYHSDEWIMNHVREHYEEAKTLINPEHIVGVFYQGSGNYGLDSESSDVDTKCIITPSFEDIALARAPISTTHIRANTEHIDLKDVRLYAQTFRKQNLNFVEILFSPYTIINPLYKDQWQILIDNREAITHYDPFRAVKSMKGIAAEKYHAMTHRYPSRAEVFDKFSYDPKQLYQLLRIEEFIYKYTANLPYEECLRSNIREHLLAVKSGEKYGFSIALAIAEGVYEKISVHCEDFFTKYCDKEPDKEVNALLDKVTCDIMKISVLNDMKGD